MSNAMVQRHDFVVEMVDAQTRQPFKEHPGRNGYDSYVEVEPGVEYFLKLKSYYKKLIITTFEVDGKDLGYRNSFSPGNLGKDKIKGLWKYENNTSSHTALKVDKMVFVPNNTSSTVKDTKVGEINVYIYEKILMGGYYYLNDHSINWEGQSGVQNGDGIGKKMVKSSVGNASNFKSGNGRRSNCRKGQLLGTIKLKYCSTVGLIAAGVLPKAPQWEWIKMIKPSVINDKKLDLKPILIDHSLRSPDGEVIEEKKIEMFDLTSMLDDDDE